MDVSELKAGITAVLNVDRTQHSLMQKALAVPMAPAGQEIVRNRGEANRRNNAALLRRALTELGQQDSKEAVDAICILFRSNVTLFRLLAITALSVMQTPDARRALRKRIGLLSFATNEEKTYVRAVLSGSKVAICSACWKVLKPFPVPAGPWAGTIEDLKGIKLGPDHALVCDQCVGVVCLVCSGEKASELGMREFVCTACGHSPLRKVYREGDW